MQKELYDGSLTKPEWLPEDSIEKMNMIENALKEANVKAVRIFNVDRNDLCPCNSGKKYKNCCIHLKSIK